MNAIARRALLSGAAALSACSIVPATASVSAFVPGADPVPARAAELLTIHDEVRAAEELTDDLTDALVQRIGTPRVKYGVYRQERGGAAIDLFAETDAEIDDVTHVEVHSLGRPDRRERLKAELRQAKAAWQREAERAGLAKADRAAGRLFAEEMAAFERVVNAPATSWAGVKAKLETAQVYRPGSTDHENDLAWRLIRSALADIGRISAGA